MTDPTICPSCGENTLVRRSRKKRYSYKGFQYEIDQPGLYCDNCKEVFLTPQDMKISDEALRNCRRRVEGFLSPPEIKEIRGMLGLSQKGAGKLFGGGPRAFSKYERGETLQSKTLDQLLRLLRSRKIGLDSLKQVEDQPAVDTWEEVTGFRRDLNQATMPSSNFQSREATRITVNVSPFAFDIACRQAAERSIPVEQFAQTIIEENMFATEIFNTFRSEIEYHRAERLP